MQILLGITGGIAAYKMVDVSSTLRQRGCDVRVAMTPSAQAFVQPTTFAAVSGAGVLTEMFGDARTDDLKAHYPHLYPAMGADAFVLAPATANTIAKIATGIADNVVTCSAISLPKSARRFFCPAMNARMWEQDVVQENAALLRERGWQQLGPDNGHLACGVLGAGRMVDPASIVEAVLATEDRVLAGKRVLILSGPTREPIDAVRYITNHSSGLMGKLLAEQAVAAGATVDFVTGPVTTENLPSGPGIQRHPVGTAAEMLAAGQAHFADADIAIFVAAVADFTISDADTAIKMARGAGVQLSLTPTVDIAATLSAQKRPDQCCVGFSLEATADVERATAKRARKQLDGMVLNTVEAMNAEDGTFTWIGQSTSDWGPLSKRERAGKILQQVAALV